MLSAAEAALRPSRSNCSHPPPVDARSSGCPKILDKQFQDEHGDTLRVPLIGNSIYRSGGPEQTNDPVDSHD